METDRSTVLTTPPLDGLRAICPSCRRLTVAGSECLLDGEPAISLANADARKRMLDVVWGSSDQRGALARGIVERDRRQQSLGAAYGYFAGSAPWMVGFGCVGVATGLLAGFRRERILVPSDPPPLPEWPVSGRGTVVAPRTIVAPGSREPCAAWSLVLRFMSAASERARWGRDRVVWRARAPAASRPPLALSRRQ